MLLVLSALLISLPLSSCAKIEKVTVNYLRSEGGRIVGKTTQIMAKGQNGDTVTAVAYDGYKFSGWSDGVTEAKRTDINITEDLTVTALFEKTVFTITYIAGEGGSIVGQKIQQASKGKSTLLW